MKHFLAQAYWRTGLWVGTRPVFVLLATGGLAFPLQAQAANCGSLAKNSFSGFSALLGSVAGFLSGSFGRAAVIIAIAIFGALMMFGELKGIFGTGIKILFGGSLILMATQWAGMFSGFSSSVTACNFILGS